jgi:DNA-binding CsgD family transcriptional regulator
MSAGLSYDVRTPPVLSIVPNMLSIERELSPADFNMTLQRLETPDECTDLFARFIAPFGFDTFASGEVDLNDRSRSTFHIIHWPARWAEYYRASGLIDRDPIVEALAHRTAPFTWSDLRTDKSLSHTGTRALNRASAAGWTEGLIVPVRQASGRIGLISLAGNRDCTQPAERDYLTLISICLHNHVRTLVGRHGFASPPAGLTPREIDALRLVVLGMSDSAMGRALGIASSTAHEFVEKAKRKMNVRSRAELAALAVSLAIVNI